MLFDLLNMGLLSDENGKLSDSTRNRVLEAVGYGGWDVRDNKDDGGDKDGGEKEGEQNERSGI